jgi:hypothetical protein
MIFPSFNDFMSKTDAISPPGAAIVFNNPIFIQDFSTGMFVATPAMGPAIQTASVSPYLA